MGCDQKAQQSFLHGVGKLRLAKAPADGFVHAFFIARICALVTRGRLSRKSGRSTRTVS
jgi:hypothetical protein